MFIGPFDLRLSDGVGVLQSRRRKRARCCAAGRSPPVAGAKDGGLQLQIMERTRRRDCAASLRQTLSALRRALARWRRCLQADRTTVTLFVGSGGALMRWVWAGFAIPTGQESS